MAVDKGFKRHDRLRKTDEISSVFAFRRRAAGTHLVVFGKPNELGRPRAAIVVARRVAPRAVNRNRMRRVLREAFRLSKTAADSLDLVVRVQRSFSRPAHAAVRAEFVALLERLTRWSASSSSSSGSTSAC